MRTSIATGLIMMVILIAVVVPKKCPTTRKWIWRLPQGKHRRMSKLSGKQSLRKQLKNTLRLRGTAPSIQRWPQRQRSRDWGG